MLIVVQVTHFMIQYRHLAEFVTVDRYDTWDPLWNESDSHC